MCNPTLYHVNLKTTRLREMINWHGTVVGLKPPRVAPVGAFLTNDAASHRLALFAFPGMSDDVDRSLSVCRRSSPFRELGKSDRKALVEMLVRQPDFANV